MTSGFIIPSEILEGHISQQVSLSGLISPRTMLSGAINASSILYGTLLMSENYIEDFEVITNLELEEICK